MNDLNITYKIISFLEKYGIKGVKDMALEIYIPILILLFSFYYFVIFKPYVKITLPCKRNLYKEIVKIFFLTVILVYIIRL